MGRGKGGSTSYGKRTPSGIKTSSKIQMSAIGEVEAKHGVLGEDQSQVNPFVGTASNLTAKRIDGQRGSNPGGTFESADGTKNYAKIYRMPGQAYGEAVANKIYNALGIKAPNSTLFSPENPDDASAGRGIANQYMQGKILNSHGLTPEIADKILDGAAADILLANWDTIGLVNDNILVSPEGEPIRIDNGGSLLYRAQGANKPGAVLNQISEWDVFANDGSRDGASNDSYAAVIQAAGYSSFDDIMPRMREQVNKINQVAETTNDFEDLVPMAPGVNHEERNKILTMLRARHKLLKEKTGANKGLGGTSAMKKDTAINDEVAKLEKQNFPKEQQAFQEPTFPNATGIAFASPNRLDTLPKVQNRVLIKRAENRLASQEQKAFKEASDKIDKMLGLNHQSADAIGVWIDGAENSTATKYDNGDANKIQVATAMKGFLGRQKQVAIFTPNPEASGAVYEFNTTMSPSIVNMLLSVKDEMMDENVVQIYFPYHTLIPIDKNRIKVSILEFSPSPEKLAALQSIAKQLNGHETEIHQTSGDIEFLGDEGSRDIGGDQYTKQIAQFMEKNPEYQKQWNDIMTDWDFDANPAQDEGQYPEYQIQADQEAQKFIVDAAANHIKKTSETPKEDIEKLQQKHRDNKLFTSDKIPTMKQILKIIQEP